MEIFTLDQLNSIHRVTRLLPVILGVLTALVTGFNIFLSARISTLEKEEYNKTKARLETAEQKIVSTQAIADTAQKTSEQLKEAARPRQLTPEQVSSITAALRESSKYTIELQCIINNSEARQFAEQIRTTFEAAGFSIASIGQVIINPPLKGIKIKTKVRYDKGMDKALAMLLRSQQLPLVVGQVTEQPADITIQIGQKN